jgi:hypothetical protein
LYQSKPTARDSGLPPSPISPLPFHVASSTDSHIFPSAVNIWSSNALNALTIERWPVSTPLSSSLKDTENQGTLLMEDASPDLSAFSHSGTTFCYFSTRAAASSCL